jgi:hypothetical protein
LRLLAGRRVLINQRFAVEFDRRTVGIAVRVPGGFMFYSSDGRFQDMDGRMFRRARAIERELKKVDQKKWKRNRRPRLSVAA